MKDFIVHIYPIKGGEFFTTFTHPLTKKKVRQRFKSRQEALDYRNHIEEKFTKPKVENFYELNVEELLGQFNLDRSDNSFVKHSRAHLMDFVDTFGHYKIEEVTTEALRTWLDQIQRENNLKNITMRGMKCDIDRFFKYLIEKDIISDSPLTTIYYEKSVPQVNSRNLLTESEISDLLKAVKAFSPGYLYPLTKIFAETAGKTSEVIDLLWKNIDLTKGEIHFPRTNASCERVLKLSDELIEMSKKRKSNQGYVFLTYYGETFTKNKVSRALNEFMAKGTFHRSWSPMDLRHSFAVNFLNKGGSLRELQYILGHKNVFQTKQLYGELSRF